MDKHKDLESLIYLFFLNGVCCVSQVSSALADLQNDASTCIKELLYTESDLLVTPIMDNPKVGTKLKAVRDMKISTDGKAKLSFLFLRF